MLVKSPLVLSDSARGLEDYNPPCQADLHVALLSMLLPGVLLYNVPFEMG